MRNLEPIYTHKVVDFYGVNKVKNKGKLKILFDCGSPVASVDLEHKMPILLIRHPTDWELIAIKEFFKQNGFDFTDTKVSMLRKICSL